MLVHATKIEKLKVDFVKGLKFKSNNLERGIKVKFSLVKTVERISNLERKIEESKDGLLILNLHFHKLLIKAQKKRQKRKNDDKKGSPRRRKTSPDLSECLYLNFKRRMRAEESHSQKDVQENPRMRQTS